MSSEVKDNPLLWTPTVWDEASKSFIPNPQPDPWVKANHDPVNHPSHYTSNASGIECIDVVEHMSFNVGNAVKYLWRAGLKDAVLIELRKARWYIDREIQRLEKEQK